MARKAHDLTDRFTTRYEKTCVECEAPFVSARRDAQWCSNRCYGRHKRRKYGHTPRPVTERTRLMRRAQGRLGVAVAEGMLVEPCLFCGDPDVVGHHHDYTLPLAVTWLCRRHHALAHSRARA